MSKRAPTTDPTCVGHRLRRVLADLVPATATEIFFCGRLAQ
jgi:hypothetical protein